MIFRKKQTGSGASNLNHLAVLGSGPLGCGISIALAQADLPVILWTRREESRARRKLRAVLQQDLRDFSLDSEEKKRILTNIYITTELSLIAESDLIIEAVTDNINMKKRLFKTLGHLCTPSTILATHTSSLNIDEIASRVSYPERVVGLHFFHPVCQASLVEVVCGGRTSEETVTLIRELAMALKKEVVRV